MLCLINPQYPRYVKTGSEFAEGIVYPLIQAAIDNPDLVDVEIQRDWDTFICKYHDEGVDLFRSDITLIESIAEAVNFDLPPLTPRMTKKTHKFPMSSQQNITIRHQAFRNVFDDVLKIAAFHACVERGRPLRQAALAKYEARKKNKSTTPITMAPALPSPPVNDELMKVLKQLQSEIAECREESNARWKDVAQAFENNTNSLRFLADRILERPVEDKVDEQNEQSSAAVHSAHPSH